LCSAGEYGNGSYNKGYFVAVNNGNINDLTLTAGLPICLGNCWTIKPSINYATMLSDPVREAPDNSDDLWFGVTAAVEF
jgi:hypothetical protein